MMIYAADLRRSNTTLSHRTAMASRAVHSCAFGTMESAVRVHFDDPESAADFGERYRDLSRAGDPAVNVYAVRDSGGTHFWTSRGESYVWDRSPLAPSSVSFLADALATRALLGSLPGTVALHAAALRWRNSAFALTGVSTAGKTTTAVACVAAGCGLYSDERCIASASGVSAYPRTLNVRAEGLQLLVDDLPAGILRDRLAAYRGADWRNVRLRDLDPAYGPPEPAPLRALFAIAGTASAPSIAAISPAKMLRAAHLGALCGRRGVARAAALLGMLSHVNCYELVLGRPFQTAVFLTNVLEGIPQ